jgi:hypothetical protein
MKKYFENVTLPSSSSKLKILFEEAFQKLTGSSLNSENQIFIKKYDNGGMSSGKISIEFWENQLHKVLIEKLKEYKF